ncbi:hypothetical protein [Kitasatospora sp. NPDC015120]|uniref:hypothetical protein n=1 Tax=Kitasatospora sp. NPDC015120 TaxID=3364023 RepID=UPI0036F49211
MAGFAALLIGASDYDLAGCTPLPFVPRDLERLGGALRDRGFRVVLPTAHGRVGANFVNGEVGHFLRTARRGETLLVCLSGHGLHAEGQDYLIPEDLHSGVEPPWSGCIAIDWRREVEWTPAARVLFLIDACRNGVRQDFMSGTVGWASRDALVVAGRQVAHLYACSPGEYARFVGAGEPGRGPDGGSFSLFSRAVLDTLLAHDGPLNLEELRVATQARIQEFHRGYGKQGRAQSVRVLTDVDQTAFVVAGPARGGAVPTAPTAAPAAAPAADGPAPVLQPLAADPRRLLGRAVFELQTARRTDLLEEYAAVAPAADLLVLDSLPAAPEAVAALWKAAALRRTPASLVELAAVLCAAGSAERAHRLLAAAAAVRPADELLHALAAAGLPGGTADELRVTVLRTLGGLPAALLVAGVLALGRAGLEDEAAWVLARPRPPADLLPLVVALAAEDLTAEADRLLRESVAAYGPQEVDELCEGLARAGRAEDRTAVLTLLATGPHEAVVAWLAAVRRPAGSDADAAFVLRTAVARREDRHVLLEALGDAGLPDHLDTALGECCRLPVADVHAVLRHLTGRGATGDAGAVLARALLPFRPKEAAELAVLLDRHGPAALLESLCRHLSGEPPVQVAAFVRHMGTTHTLATAVASSLGRSYPLDGAVPLVRALREHARPAFANRFQRELLLGRPPAEVLPMLDEAGDQDRSLMLEQVLAARPSPEQLAELLHLACEGELRGGLGAQMAAVFLVGTDDGTIAAVLAELGARGRAVAQQVLLGQVALGMGPAHPERFVQWLLSHGLHDHAAAQLARVAEEGGARDVALLHAHLRAGEPELATRLLVQAAGQRSAVFLAELAAALTRDPDAPGAAALGAAMLRRVAERRPPAEVADLLVAADGGGPEHHLPTDVTGLLDAFLRARPADEIASLLRELHARNAGSAPGSRLAAAVRADAPLLFHAARTSGAEGATRYVLDAFRDEPPLRINEVDDLLRNLYGNGSLQEALDVLGRLGRLQPPSVVAGLLTQYLGGPLGEQVCRGAEQRPPEAVAEILALLGDAGAPDHELARTVGRFTAPDRCRAVLVELLAARRGPVAGAVLAAAPWSGVTQELIGLLSALGREDGERRRAALETLVLEPLTGEQTMELLHHVHRNGPHEAVLPVLRAVAPTSDAPSVWLRLHALGWFRDAAVLLDRLPPDTDVVPWFRQLPDTPDADREALLRESGADGPLGALVAGAGPARAALITAVLHRPPAEIAGLLFAPVGDPARWTELRRILAAARRSAELDAILQPLAGRGRDDVARLVTDRLVAEEPAGRIAGLMGGGPVAPGLIAASALGQGVTAALAGRLLMAGHDRSAEALIDATVIAARDGAQVAEVVVGLAGAHVPAELRQRLVRGFCRQHSHRPRSREGGGESQANTLLSHLVRAGLGADAEDALTVVYLVGSEERGAIMRKLRAATTAEEPKPPARWRPWRKDTHGP